MELFSAKDASYEFLLRKVGKDMALQMINSASGNHEDTTGGSTETDGSSKAENEPTDSISKRNKEGHSERWMLKYMAFGAIILKYRKQLNMGCARVISIGDGEDEAHAIKEYANEHKVECVHFGFLRNPVIEQLVEQWAVIERTFAKLIHLGSTGIPNDYFRVHEMLTIYKVDNNRHFSGKKRQLPALTTYYNLWLSLVEFSDSLSLNISLFSYAIIHCIW